MDTQTAVNLVTQTFEAAFDAGAFRTFVRNTLTTLDESKAFGPYQGAYIKEAFRDHVSQLWRVGTYTDPNGEKIDVLIVRLKRAAALDRARTMQRNFVARYLKERDAKDAALIATYAGDSPDWRFSLVKMAYRVEVSDRGLRVKEELSPARRYSFLVGAGEPNHTAQQQLVPLLQTARPPTLAALEAAFDIEPVTKAFFEAYKALFLDLKDELDALAAADRALATEFERTGIATANFAKKLLGQLVFLTFLQKKGWLGVEPGAAWGSGPHDFLRRLLDGRYVAYDNFFNEVLEPLFYEALAIERPGHAYARLACRIPFLNGGLFEPAGGYDWRGVDVPLSNARFHAILDAFERYNFTVREDEPFEKEVAVDPEMLGKVFENLLDVADRKSKGAFYTPREIVHYMCQESLVAYLDATLNPRSTAPVVPPKPQQGALFEGSLFATAEPEQLGLTTEVEAVTVPREDLETFIRRGELSLENDTTTAAKPHETGAYAFELPAAIREHAAALDAALARIKICDPAIGSGAFPVGLMHEIVKARTVLTPHLAASPSEGTEESPASPAMEGIEESPASPPSGGIEGGKQDRTPYALKRHAIQTSIYGVDIDPGAVDIAKLRLWLSLVVDEARYDQIQPLPNLDYKIVCGNALLGYPETWRSPAAGRLEALKVAYFSATDPAAKARLRDEIDQQIAARLAGAEKALGYPIDFDARILFSEVFRAQGGFDLVAGNPPYVRHERIRDQKPALKQAHPEIYRGTADLYVYFYSQGLKLLRDGGFLAFITSNKFMRAGYGKKVRRLLIEKATPRTVIDFGDLPVFDATAYPCIVMARKAPPPPENVVQALTVETVPQIRRIGEVMAKRAWAMPQRKALTAEGWNLEAPAVFALLDKLYKAGKPLEKYVDRGFYRGVTTGLNKAFVIDQATHDRLVAKQPASAKVLKPFLRGRNVKRWQVEFAGQYLLFIPWHFPLHQDDSIQGASKEAEEAFQEQYPAIYNYLLQYKERLSKRNKAETGIRYEWYALQRCAATYYEELDKPKIIYPDIAKSPEFAYDEEGHYLVNTLYLMPTDEKWLLGVLNSRAVFWFYTKISTSIRGDYVRFIAQYVSQIPIPPAPNPNPIEPLVARILAAKVAEPDADVRDLEAEIDRHVYRLYGLTAAEIDIIEDKLGV